MLQTRRWHIYPHADDLYRRAADAIMRAAEQAIAARGAFHIVLAGGATPQPLYTLLRSARADWSRWHVYFGDERCLPAGDGGRNDTVADTAWLRHVLIPPTQIWRIPADLGPDQGARRYTEVLASVDYFDVVLLGVGEDGHTASLFPHHPADQGDGAAAAIAIHDSPKPPPQRISLSAARLSRARQVFFLVIGSAKQDAIAAWARGEALPVARITPKDGVDILADRSAMPAGVPVRF